MQKLIQHILHSCGIKWSKSYLSDRISTSPFNNSLFGLGSILSHYGISNQAVRFEDKSELMADACPCVVVLNGSFAAVDSINRDSITLYDEFSGEKQVSPEQFMREWNGVALLIQPDKHSAEPDFEAHRRQERLAQVKRLALTACVTICVALGIILNPLNSAWYWWALLVINLAGVGISFLLLQKQLHIPNKFADKLCGLAKESHCDDVTQSNGADFFGLVKLSEIGGGFFTVNTLALLFWSPQALYFLALVAACVLPFSFWSIWYQKRKAKSWCVLCLCTLALMWLQAGAYLAGGVFSHVSHQWTVALGLVAVYIAAVLLINYVMNILARKGSATDWQLQFNTLKTQDKVIHAYEDEASIFATNAEECSSLIFGNPDAERQITIFSNPYCGPCAKMHERVKIMPGRALCVRYVMTYFSEQASKINRYIIAAYMQLGAEKAWDLMTEWYAGGKSRGEEFFSGLNLNPDSDEVTAEFEKHNRWRDDDRLIGTPTVLLNGRELVGPYTVEDYFYIPA